MVIPKALMLGLSTGAFCLGYCYPILGPIMLSREETGFHRTGLALGLFLLGRLAAYLLFGFLAGLMGRRLEGVALVQRILIPLLFLALGLLLILYGLVRSLPQVGFCRLTGRYFQDQKFLLLAGFLAGINLCPPFLLALSYALSLGKIAGSVVFFLFFFLATSLYLLPFLFSGLLSRFQDVRAAARVTAVVVGAWFLFLAVKRLLA